MRESLGMVETVGISTAIEVADVMVKAANVRILEVENSKGSGFMTVKVVGDVGAVKAAVSAAKACGEKFGTFVSASVIARPAEGMGKLFMEPKSPYTSVNQSFRTHAPRKGDRPAVKPEAPKVEEPPAKSEEKKEEVKPEVKKPEEKPATPSTTAKVGPAKTEAAKTEPAKVETKKAGSAKDEPKEEVKEEPKADAKPEAKAPAKAQPAKKTTARKTRAAATKKKK